MPEDGRVGTFNIHLTKGSFAGINLEGPFAEDDIFKVEWLDKSWDIKIGAKGGISRGHNQGGRHARVTIAFQQTSPTVKLLVAQHKVDTDPDGSGAPAVMILRSASEEVTFTSAQAFIEKRPDWSAGKGVKDREVSWICPWMREEYDS